MRFVTEYRHKADGLAYDGPQIEATGRLMAEAVAGMLYGPAGERVEVLGELVTSIQAFDLAELACLDNRPTKES